MGSGVHTWDRPPGGWTPLIKDPLWPQGRQAAGQPDTGPQGQQEFSGETVAGAEEMSMSEIFLACRNRGHALRLWTGNRTFSFTNISGLLRILPRPETPWAVHLHIGYIIYAPASSQHVRGLVTFITSSCRWMNGKVESARCVLRVKGECSSVSRLK